MQSAAKENLFRYMCVLSERLFLSAVREACAREDSAHRVREYWMELFFTFYKPWTAKYTECPFLQVSLLIGLKWKQTAEKENTCVL